MKRANFVILRWSNVPLAIFNFVIIPCFIFLLAFNINSFHGIVDAMESGQYLSCINAVFQGMIPYRDFIPPVGPLFIWILSAVFLMLGKTIYVLRLYFLIATIVIYIILYFFGYNLYRFKISAYILPVIALVETYNPFWSSRWAGYSRLGAGLFGLLLQVLYIKKNKPSLLFFSGVAAGFSLLYGIDSGVTLIVCGIFLCFLMALYESTDDIKEIIVNIIKRGGVFCLGLAVILVPFIVYMVFNKALFPCLEGTYLVMRYHIPAWHTSFPPFIGSLEHYNNNLWVFFISDEFRTYMPGIFYFLSLIYAIYAFRKKTITDCVMIPLILAYGILTCIIGCRIVQGPQFDAALLPLLLLMIYFTEKSIIFIATNLRYLIKREKIRGNAFCLIIAALVAAISSTYIIASHKRVYDSWPGWIGYQKHKDKVLPEYTFLKNKNEIKLITVKIERIGPILLKDDEGAEIAGVTEYIRNNTLKGEPVFAFPEHGLYNFLADRPGVTRFQYAVYAHTAKTWRKELLSDLKANSPRYIIYSRSLSNTAKNIGMKSELLPEVVRFIAENYHLEKSFGQTGIYRKNS